VDLCTGDYDGRTALHLAVCNGHEAAARFLVDEIAPDPVNTLNVVDRCAVPVLQLF
jgi:hypothetical protein